jgi:uncharacterized protein
MMIIRVLALLLALCVGFAQAQDTNPAPEDDPLLGSETETPLDTSPSTTVNGRTQQILVIGDKLAGGLGGGLLRLSEGGEQIAITNRFNEISGLARPDFYDWPKAIAALTEGKQFGAIIIMIGVNDRREFRSAQGRFAYGTPAWQQAYAGQIDALLAAIKARNIPTFWVGLPPMADSAFDETIQQMNALAKTRVEAAGARYIDIRADFLNPDGSYTDRGLDETGAPRKMRSRDGINFFKAGNTKMARLVLNVVKGATASAQTTVAGATPEAETNPIPQGPLIGEAGNNGEELVTDAREIKIAAAQPAAAPEKAAALHSVFASQANSFSERLFTLGEPPVPPPGRFDDFSVLQQ